MLNDLFIGDIYSWIEKKARKNSVKFVLLDFQIYDGPTINVEGLIIVLSSVMELVIVI